MSGSDEQPPERKSPVEPTGEPLGEPPGAPPEEPQGLAEEIRHEIAEAVEEVVEHVPKPIRWTVGKLVRLVVLALVGLVVVVAVTAILYVVNRTEWAAQELALLVNQALVSRSDLAIEIGDIKGNPFTGVRVMRPVVRFREGDLAPLMDVREMRLRYSAWDLATGGRGPIQIDLDGPVFHLQRGPDGTIRLPKWRSGTGSRAPRGFDVVLRVHGGTVMAPDTALRIEGFGLDAFAHTGPDARLDVRGMRWDRGPYGSVLERCIAEYTVGDSSRIRVRELRTGDIRLQGQAAWKGDGDAVVHVVIDRLRWRWLHRITKRDDVNVPGEGRIVVDAVGRRALAGRFEGQGVWDSLAVEGEGGFTWRDGRLHITPLTARSAAGDIDGALTWSKQGWDLESEVKHGDPARWWILGIRNWPAGNLNGRFRYAVDLRRVKHARLAARLAASEWTGWHADSGTVTVDFTPVGPDTFTVRARRGGGEMRLYAVTDPTGWSGTYELQRFPLDEWPDGHKSGLRGAVATGRGSVASHRGDLQVTGALEGGVTDWLGIHTARWRMTDIRGALLPVPDLDGDLRLGDLFFLQVHWDSAGVPIHVGDGRAALPRLFVAAGDTTMRLEARAEWDDRGWRFTADSAAVRSSQFAWTADPPMVISGDPHRVHFDRLVARDGPARLTIEGDWAGPGGNYDWTARTQRLDLGRLGFPREWGLVGSADARLRVTGVAGDPRWELTGIARQPGARGGRIDSLRLELGGGPARVDVGEAHAMLGEGALVVTGQVTGMEHAWPDTLTGEGIARWVAGAVHWSGEVRADQVPLDRLDRMAARPRGLQGAVDGVMMVAGRPGAPELDWSVGARPLSYGDYRIDAATARGRYRDRRLDVSELRLTRTGVASTVTGTLPLALAVGSRPELPDQPMDWKIEVPNGDLAVLPVFLPQIGAAAGRFDVSAHLQGTPRRPSLSGTASIRDGKARMAGREEELEAIHADLTLSEARITLDSLTARQRKRTGAPGLVTGRGVVDLAGLALKGYRFDLRLRDFTAVDQGMYAAQFDGDFVVTDGPRVKGATLPMVVGNAELRRGVVLVDFTSQSQVDQVAAATQRLYWLYRIQLNATDNLHWQPPDADIEFSADLRMEQTPDSLIIFGDMTSLRGNYHYLSNRYTVDQANLTFDNVGGVNPKLDIVAVTQVPRTAGDAGSPLPTPASEEEQNRGPVTIEVTITGRAAEPVMTFSSWKDPARTNEEGWDQPTILRALTYGPYAAGAAFGAAGERLADDWVTRNLNRQLSSEMSRIFQGYVTEWELARESGGLFRGEGDVYLRVGSQVSRNLNVAYRQRVPGFTRDDGSNNTTLKPFERDVEAQYRLNRFFYISTEVTQRRQLSSSTNAQPPEYNVSLKARWEY